MINYSIPQGLEHVMAISPDILGGEPVFIGTRVPLETAVDNLIAGHSPERIMNSFPSLRAEHLLAVQQWLGRYARQSTGSLQQASV